MKVRSYDPDGDFEAVLRIWREVGWIEPGNDAYIEGLRVFAEEYDGLVAEVDGDAECYVATGPGNIRHTGTDLPLSAVSAVTTSHVARRQGLAQRLTATAIANDAVAGAAVSALGIFDQGFYNKLGFGSGSYERWHTLDPAHLRVPVTARPPKRLTTDDWEAVHSCRLRRMRRHGSCNLDVAAATRSEMLWAHNGFGLGYADGPAGAISHLVWFSAKELENGPIEVWWMAYETYDQFLELMALISNLGDQVHAVRMREPAAIQLQDLIHEPFRRRRISQKSQFEVGTQSYSYWQLRICDVEACVAAATLHGESIRFNLTLTDPIVDYLDDSFEWRGSGGEYVVEFGEASSAVRGSDPALPTLEASVGAFTRLWLGVLPATGLAVTDDLNGPPALLVSLDRVLRLREPKPDWDF